MKKDKKQRYFVKDNKSQYGIYFLNMLFLTAIIYVLISLFTYARASSSIFTLLLLFHWCVGTNYFFKIRPRPNLSKKVSVLMFFIIALLLILGIAYMNYPVLMFAFFGAAFIPVIPLYRSILKQETNDRFFVRIKYILEYVGATSFFLNSLLLYFKVLESSYVINITTFIHLLIISWLLLFGIYPGRKKIAKVAYKKIKNIVT